MRKEDAGVDNKRRNFLKLATVSVPAVAASAAVGTQAAAVELPEDTSGLQDTAHTRAYFETARF